MADIASLGFAIDTSGLTRANTELNKFVSNAGKAEKAADRFGQAASNAGAVAANAMGRAANAAQGAAAAFGAGSASAAAAARNVIAAQNAAAAAARAQAAASNAATAANNTHAHSATRSAAANSNLSTTFLGLNASTLLSTAAMIAAGHAVMKAADAYTQLQNTLKIAGLSGNEMVAVQDRLFEAANRNGVAIEEITQFFRRMSITQKEVGASNLDMVKMVDAVTAALRVQGTSAKAASGALLQLSQSFGSGRVKAEEFNSIQEGALPLLQAAANGIERFKGSISQLRAEVVTGNVTSKEFFEGILRGSADLERLAATTKLTLAAALTTVENSFVNLVGRIDTATGASDYLTDALKEVSKWMDNLSKDPQFLNDVKTAFDELKAIIQTTRQEIEMIINLFKALKVGVSIVQSDIAKTKFAYSAKELAEAERIISNIEAIRQDILNQKSKETNIDEKTQNELNRQLAITNEKLEEQYRIRDSIRALISHTPPDPLSTTPGGLNPYDSNVGEGVSPFDPISTKRGPGGKVPPKKGGNSIADAYRKIQTNAAQAVAELKLQEQQLGRTEEETNRLTYAMELQNKVQDANIPLTKAVTEWIAKMALEQAKAKTSLDVSKFIHNNTVATKEYIRQQEVELDVVGMTREAATAYRKEQEALATATKTGQTLTDAQRKTIHDNAVAYAAAEEKVRSYTEALEFAKDIAKGFFQDMREGLINGRSLWESFGVAAINVLNRIADKLMNMAIDGLFAAAFGGGNGTTAGQRFLSGFGGLGGSISQGWDRFSDWAGFGGGDYADVGSLINAKGLGDSGILGSGIGWGSAIGAAGGLFSGAMGFMKGGTSGTIQGISGLLGAGASFIPGIGPFLGPAISMIGGLLGGLFGDQKPVITNQTFGQLSYSSGGWNTSGGAWGPDANSSELEGNLKGLGKSISQVFALFGGVKDATKVWGLSSSTKSISGANWSSSSSSVNLVDPSGNSQLWRMNEGNMMDTASAQVAWRSIIEGAVGDITDNMRQALIQTGQTMGGTSLQEIADAANEILLFDKTLESFGKDVPDAKAALDQLNSTFDALNGIVEKYNLAATETVKIEAERTRQQNKLADDFKYSISQGLLEFDNPLQGALNDLEKKHQADLLTNELFLKEIEGYEDQKMAIERLYLERRNKMTEEFNDSALNGQSKVFLALDELIKSMMPGGSLAGESPAAHLAGLQAAYATSKTAAFADPMNEQIVADFVQASANLAEFSKEFFANDMRFAAQRDQLIADAMALQSAGGNPNTVVNGQTVAVATDNQFQALMDMNANLAEQLGQALSTITTLTAKLDRYLANTGS